MVVIHKRTKFFCESENVSLLREEFKYVMAKYPITIDAFVLLLDHLHCLWTLPDGDRDLSKRWWLIVRVTSCEFRVSRFKCKKGNSRVWFVVLDEISRLMLKWEKRCGYWIDFVGFLRMDYQMVLIEGRF